MKSGGAQTRTRLMLGTRVDWKKITTPRRPKMRQLIAARAKVVRTNDILAVGEQELLKSVPLTSSLPLTQCLELNL